MAEPLSPDEVESQASEAVPPREVMSLIATGASPGLLPSYDAAGATQTASAAPTTAEETASLTGTDAEASASQGDATSVEGDRSETFSSTNTAQAQS